MKHSRREVLRWSGLAALGTAMAPDAALAANRRKWKPAEPSPAIAGLEDMTADVKPISREEHVDRIRRGQRIMAERGLDAVVLGPGTNLAYFTGARWGLSERFFGVVIPRQGDPAWVTPAFEKRRAEEQIVIGDDIRAWDEDASPYALVAAILRDRKAASGRLGMGERLPFVFVDGIAKELPAAEVASATPVTAGCRMIKDGHEIALIRRACEITVRAHRAVFASLAAGMTQARVAELSREAHRRLGIAGGSLVLFGADAAFPHGTTHPQPLAPGDVVLIDGGGELHGYNSDITRTGIFGEPSDRQRRIWNLVREAQQAAFGAARPGVAAEAVDAAARGVIDRGGFGPGYSTFTHRVGHGIGMDGHEWTYLVKGNPMKLAPGMCFSDEPGIYLPGELGIRHEDIITITEDGAENMTRWSGTPEEPAVV